MTIPNESSMDALREMLAERSRYEGWLAQLEQKRATTPLHVLERVRSDYRGRLDHVTEQLRGRAVELEATVAGLRSRVAALASEEEQRRDERAEAELRASVGELSEDEARQTIGACDGAINSLVAQRDAVGSELSKLQDVLHLVVSHPARAEQPDELVSVEALAPTGDQVAVESASPGAAQELEFLRSVVSRPDAANAPAQAASGGQLLDGPAGEMLPPPTLAAPRRPITPLASATIRDPLRSVAGDGSLTPGNMPSFLKDMPSEQVKTLKCQECGTMNYPTEWYCEKCGGELAAM
jgi:hypothetical protein